MRRRRLIVPALVLLLAAPGALSACGSEEVDVPDATASVQRGAQLFNERCAGCHTFQQAGAQGSATEVSDRERVDGPNFDVRKVCYENALYAIRNGGYSGAVMPGNIAVGREAEDISRFIAEYSGWDATNPASPTGPPVKCPPPPPEG